MSDKEPHITVKIKVDREELDCAIRDIKSLYEKIKEISALTGGACSTDAEIPPHPTRLPGLVGTGGGNSFQLWADF